jgi:hypothetical protein
MGSHLGYGAAALIREQAEEVFIAHEWSVGEWLGYGLPGYAFHDFALIERVVPSRSA